MKNIILCDLDGTLADLTHRRHFVEKLPDCIHCAGEGTDLAGSVCQYCSGAGFTHQPKSNWPAFHKACVDDTPLQTTIDIVSTLTICSIPECELWIVSGRSNEVVDETVEWLERHNINHDNLIMRNRGDYTPDDVLKKSWLDSGLIPKERVFCVFDDRDRVVQMWRNEGLTCYQVAPGDF